jgi:hypothetical protein
VNFISGGTTVRTSRGNNVSLVGSLLGCNLLGRLAVATKVHLKRVHDFGRDVRDVGYHSRLWQTQGSRCGSTPQSASLKVMPSKGSQTQM